MKRVKKYAVLAIFMLLIVVSVILLGSVKINYNISDYLDEETETKISMNIMEDEFNPVGNIQVMIEDITVDQAYEAYDIIRSVNGVLLVNFSPSSEEYYKKNEADGGNTGDALFAIIVDGDEYSESAAQTLGDIQSNLDNHFNGKTSYGGAVVEKVDMRNTMKKEIVIILVVSVLLSMGIMLIMANSWIEPGILLVSSGIAVIINMGTNAVFGEISYITNAVAAILQLALSIDYSIVLLHNYRDLKNNYEDKHDAMRNAVKITFRPVLASSTTTIAGLLALVFMTMKIGRDIGIVLTKGIVISMLTSLILLPALLLVCDKLMERTSKKALVLSGKKLCNIALKGGRAILLVAFALIIACGGLQLNNKYSFVDSTPPNEKMEETFGSSNTIVLLYEHHDAINWQQERDLHEALQKITLSNGYAPYKGYTGYSNTVLEEYTIEKAADKLNISVNDVKTLFALYHESNNDPENRVLAPIDFVDFAIAFLTPAEGEDYKYATKETVDTLETLSVVYDIVYFNHTADEMYKLVSTGVMEGSGLSEFYVKQMYGLYFWDEFANGDVSFETMLDFMVSMTSDEDAKSLMDEATASDLVELSNGLEDFKEQMDTLVDKKEFLEFGRDKFGTASWVDLACSTVFGLCNKNSDGEAKIVDILKLVDKVSNLIPEDFRGYITNYTYVYDVINEPCDYKDFLPILKKVVLALTDEEREVNAQESAIQQAYIMYFRSIGAIPNNAIHGFEFVRFVNEAIETNPTIGANVSEESKAKLRDVVKVKDFICDTEKYNYIQMTEKLAALQANAESIGGSSDSALNSGDIYTIYVRHVAENEDGMTDPIIAVDLLEYVVENMNDENHSLYRAMTPEHKAKVAERQLAIQAAEKLFIGNDKYIRLLISVDLDSGSEEIGLFIDELEEAIGSVYCHHSNIAGHMVATNDLRETFEKDNMIITVFTIIAIFVIIMVVFGSFSLPVLLVAIIQGAIWISMSTSLLSDPMFFMSYIIATCILMGSTIDYGILMSTNYIGYRETMDKKNALYAAVKSAMPTIFTSGLILIICGFIVGAISSLTSISTVGFLLGKGALVSVLVITLVLPSMLYFLDGFIRLFTYRCGKERRKRRRERRKARRVKRKDRKFTKKAKKFARKFARRKIRFAIKLVFWVGLECLFVYMWLK